MPRSTPENGSAAGAARVELPTRMGLHSAARRISEIAIVRIGFVTGANWHFILGTGDLESGGIPSETLKTAVTRTEWWSGLEFADRDHGECAEAGRRANVLYPEPALEDDARLKRRVAGGNESGISMGTQCPGRDAWCCAALSPKTDAFASCKRSSSPPLVLNRSGYLCRNTIHSVRWRDDTALSPEAMTIGFLTSAVSWRAEIEGRRYGDGRLKLERETLNQLPVAIWPGTTDASEELDGFMRTGREERASEIAGTRVLGEGLGLSRTERRQFQLVRLDLMAQCRPVRERACRA